MNTRDLLFALGGLVLLGAGAMVAWTSTGEAPIPGGGAVTPIAPAPPPAAELAAPAAAPTLRAGDGEPAVPAVVRSDGLVRGHITLSPGLPRSLKSAIVTIVEQGEANGAGRYSHNHRVDIDPTQGSPRFAIDGIPFSDNDYIARLFADSLNGSEQTFRVTAERPVADVVLGLSVGAYLSVVLRDQDRLAVADLPVLLIPIGEPLGRPLRREVANNFGSAKFESLLRGQYKVVVGEQTAPLNAESIIEVAGDQRVQSATVLVPRGRALTLLVNGPDNRGVTDAAVELLALDSQLYSTQKGVTDFAGKFVFEHVQPGYYQVNVNSERHERWSRNVRIDQEKAPDPVRARLIVKARR